MRVSPFAEISRLHQHTACVSSVTRQLAPRPNVGVRCGGAVVRDANAGQLRISSPRSVDNGPPADSLLERESDSSPWIPNQSAARSHERDLGILTCTVRPSRTMACMRKIEKPSPTESPLLFEFDPKPAEEVLTALGGLPLVVQAFRSLGLPGSVKQHVAVKERQRGYDEATFVESFVILNAAGGECLDDFERL